MGNVHVVFAFLILFYYMHVLLVPQIILFPPFIATCASTFLFLLLSLYEDTNYDFSKPKSGTLHAYMAFLTMFQLIMFVFLNTSTTLNFLPYSSFAHGLLVALLILITFTLYTKVNNQDAHSKKRFVRSMKQIFPFIILVFFCYTNILTMILVDRSYHHIWFEKTYDPESWLNYSDFFRGLKTIVQFVLIVAWLGTIIASSVFLVHQHNTTELS